MGALPPAAQPLSRTQSSVSLQSKLLAVPAAGEPAAALPVATLQSMKSVQFGALAPGAVAFSQVKQAAAVMFWQSAPQSFTVNFGSQTSPVSLMLLPHTAGWLSVQSGLQPVVPATDGSQASPASLKPS